MEYANPYEVHCGDGVRAIMDKKIAGLFGAAAALTAINTTTQATPAQNTELAPATTYRDLLNPVPNALSALIADNARLSRDQANERTQLAQVSVQVGHHHHHHHQVRISVLVPSATLNAVALKKATDTIPMGQAEKQVVASPINDSDASTLNQRVQGSSPCAPTISSTG
jgi:hypothetical protein